MPPDGQLQPEAAPSWVRHILVPADSSPASQEGLALAAEVAHRTGARVTVVFVRHVPAGTFAAPTAVGGEIAQTLDDVEVEVRRSAARVLDRTGIHWDLLVRSGSPGEEVLQAVKEVGANLVIIGSSRHSGVHNVLFGSTTVHVTAHSPVPVLVARPTSGAPVA